MKVLSMIFVALSLSISALASQQQVEKIRNLANNIKSLVSITEASDDQLSEAEDKLREVIQLLNQQDGSGDDSATACFEFAYEKYFQSMSSASATDKAMAACKITGDLEVLKFLYEKHFQSKSAASAMDTASQEATRATRGKLEMIKFIYDKYFQNSSATTSATKAAVAVVNLKRNSLNCLQSLYPKYFQTMSASSAMDKAILSCSSTN